MQGTKCRVCPLFPSPRCLPVMLLGPFSLETCWDGVLLREREHVLLAFSAGARSHWDGFIWPTLEICDFALSFRYIDHISLLGFLKIKQK